MSNFTDFIAKTTSEKIVLFELDYGENQRRWYNYMSGIWAWKYYTRSYVASPVLGTGNLGFDTLSGGASGDKGEAVFHTIIGSVKADGTTYTEASTLANCVSLDSSWYFDQDDQILYFHGENYTEPEVHTVIVGITKGMSNRAIDINTMFYEPRIASDIEIEKTIDSLEWGIMSFDGASLTLSNSDGYFDDMFDSYIFGQRAVVKLGGIADNLINNVNKLSYSDCESTSPPIFYGISPPVETDNATFARDDTEAYAGTYSYKMTIISGGTSVGLVGLQDAGGAGHHLNNYHTYTFSAYVYVPSSGGCEPGEAQLQIRDYGTGAWGSSTAVATVTDAWERVEVSRTIAADKTVSSVKLEIAASAASGEYFYVDNLQVEEGTAATTWEDYIADSDELPYDDYRTMFDGQVKSVQLGENSVELKLVENREKLSRMIPPNSYSQTTYSDLSDDNIGKPIPIAYGTCYKVPVMCINEEGSTPFTFNVCDVANHSDGIRAISNAYVDGVSVPISTTSLPSATFQLTGTHYTAGQKVTADIIGLYASGAVSIDSSADIIEDILEVFGDETYDSDNYNTTVWGSIDTYNIGLFIDDRTAMHDVVEKIAYSNMANFMIDDDARYSWHKFDSTESADFTVDSEEILEGEWIAPEYDSEDYLTSCHVGYAKQWDEDEYRWVSDTTYETDSFAKYGKYRELKMETLLVNSTDAIELASAVMTYMNEVRMKLKNTVGIQYIDKDIGTTCNLNGDRVDSDWMGNVKCEIVGVFKTLGNNPKMTIVGREFP